jgi:hypothetical protein
LPPFPTAVIELLLGFRVHQLRGTWLITQHSSVASEKSERRVTAVGDI